MLADSDTRTRPIAERSEGTCVLLVTDRPAWSSDTAARLEPEGYACVVADGQDLAHELILECDLAVVDLGLVGRATSEVVVGLRACSSMPILAVSPTELRATTVLEAYEAGADQLVLQTIGPRELVARVRALLRRTPPHARSVGAGSADVGSYAIDATTCVVTVMGEPVQLTTDECLVLLALVRRPGSVVPREDLAALIPGGHPGAMLDSLVRQLRNRLEAIDGRRRVEAVRGVGFRFSADAELADLATA